MRCFLKKFIFIFLLIIGWIFFSFSWPVIWKKLKIPPQIRKINPLDVALSNGFVIYSVASNPTPKWQTCDRVSNSYSVATSTVTGKIGRSFVIRTSPIKQEAIAGYVNSEGVLQIMCYNGNQWTNEWSVMVGGTGNDRRFDIAYETYTGNVIVLYSTNSSNTNELAFRIKPASSSCGAGEWSPPTNFDPLGTSGIIRWVKMVPDRRPTSTLVAAIWVDSNFNLSAAIWSGTGWGNEFPSALETSFEVLGREEDIINYFDVEYESLSGDVLVVWANSTPSNWTRGGRYATCNGGTFDCTWSSPQPLLTFADNITYLSALANPNTDEILFASVNGQNDLQHGYWSGSSWTNVASDDITTYETPPTIAKYFAIGWLISGETKKGIVVYYNANSPSIKYKLLTLPNTGIESIDLNSTQALENPLEQTFDYFDIFYTLEGQTWEYLGSITNKNLREGDFFTPVNDWLTIPKIQIKLQLNPIIENILYLYLETTSPEAGDKNFDENNEEKELNVKEFPQIENFDFSRINLIKIKGISPTEVILFVSDSQTIGGQLWLVNLEDKIIKKISEGIILSSDNPLIVSKDNFIFWVNENENLIFAADYKNQKIYQNKIPLFDKSKGERVRIKFKEINYEIIYDGHNLYFKDEKYGEIFSDDYSLAVENFRKNFNLDKFLTKEKLEELGFVIEEQ